MSDAALRDATREAVGSTDGPTIATAFLAVSRAGTVRAPEWADRLVMVARVDLDVMIGRAHPWRTKKGIGNDGRWWAVVAFDANRLNERSRSKWVKTARGRAWCLTPITDRGAVFYSDNCTMFFGTDELADFLAARATACRERP